MPGLRLECLKVGDVELLLQNIEFVHRRLQQATRIALHSSDVGVGVSVIHAPGYGNPRIIIRAEVSEDKTPAPQDMEAWGIALVQAVQLMREAAPSHELGLLFDSEISVWTGLVTKDSWVTLSAEAPIFCMLLAAINF